MGGSEFLKKKYDLHNTPEVDAAASRTERRTGDRVPQDPASRIQNYLNRFTDILDREDPHDREQGIEALKRILHRQFVITPEDVPESAFLLAQRIDRELGHGDVEITDEFKERKIVQIIADQDASLDKWINYFASPDADYPDWAMYWATRSILEMGKFQKEATEDGKEVARFGKRTKDTTAPFAPWNPRALAMTISAMEARIMEQGKPKAERSPVANTSKRLDAAAFQQLLSTENFAKLYTQFLIELPEYSTEGLQETRGQWVRYERGSDPTTLVTSLDGYPLEWCTANPDTARTQLEAGDFYVYYSINKDGDAVIPRAAIRMEEDRIAEVRGIAPNQNLDPFIGAVVGEKMHEFPDGAAYEKKAGDMKRLTEIEQKSKGNEPLTKDDLTFLYEINAPIEGFGYARDPRIQELRATRNLKEDAPIVLGCAPEHIAWNKEDIHPTTTAYIGPLFPGIFALDHLQHLYVSFPERRITHRELPVGGKTLQEYTGDLQREAYRTDDWSDQILKKVTPSKERRILDLVRLTVADLGFTGVARYDQICRRAQELGLELCPSEVGPALRLAMPDQPMNDWVVVAMEPLTDSRGYPGVFSVSRNADGRWLLADDGGRPDDQWYPDGAFVFVSRKQ